MTRIYFVLSRVIQEMHWWYQATRGYPLHDSGGADRYNKLLSINAYKLDTNWGTYHYDASYGFSPLILPHNQLDFN